jgi:hypothetical protein
LLGGPDEFDQETLYTIMKNAEDVLFFKPGITRGDSSRAVDAAVRGGFAVITSTNENYDHLWNLYMSIVRPWLAEGVEDALSLWKADAGTTIVASLGVKNIGKAPINAETDVVIFRDGDEPESTADKAIIKGVDRLILAGANVRVTETLVGLDANDLFVSEGATAILRLIDEAPEAELSPEGVFDKCALMTQLEYEQVRPEIAKDLKLRLKFLDDEVKFRRQTLQIEIDADSNTALCFAEIEPWPERVDLTSVLDEIASTIGQYVHLKPVWIHTCALWAALTHAVDMVHVLPRLAAQSPGPGCGKTVLMEAISNLVPRALTASSITAASVFRVIEALQPTLMIDEADQLFRGDNADLVAVMNSGHRRSSAYVVRTVEVSPGKHEAVQFSTWAPMMTASIRELPPTLQDRSIVVHLQRALPGEVSKHLRDGSCPVLLDCARKLARWAQDIEDLPEVNLPPAFSNRFGDNWRPLFAIASLAGEEWPARVLAAAKASLIAGDHGLITVLLVDIREVFGGRDSMSSQEIVDGLIAMEEAPYGETNRRRPITPYWLAKQLSGVIKNSSQTIRSGNRTAKGYYRAQFEDAWMRYRNTANVPEAPSEPPINDVTSVTPSQTAESVPPGGTETVTPGASHRHTTDGETPLLRCDAPDVTDADCKKPVISATCDGVTGVTEAARPSAEAPGTPDQETW